MCAEPAIGCAMISYLPSMKRRRDWRPGCSRTASRAFSVTRAFLLDRFRLGGPDHAGLGELGHFRLAAEHFVAQRDDLRLLKPLRIGAPLLHLRIAQRVDSVLVPVQCFFP